MWSISSPESIRSEKANEWVSPTFPFAASLRLLDYDCDVPQRIDTVDPDYLGTAIATFLVQSLFFVLRIMSRWMGVGKWGWDDHICILAYVSSSLKPEFTTQEYP